MTEFWLDVFDDKPLEVHRNADGFVQLQDTGDPLIDKWEQQIADGQEPDLWEAFTPEDRRDLERLHKRTSNSTASSIQPMTMGDTMDRVQRIAKLNKLNDPYTGQSPEASKFLNIFGDGSDE